MKKIPPMLLKTEFKEKDEWWSMKMIGNTVFAIADKPHADILILSKNPETFEWTKEEQKTGQSTCPNLAYKSLMKF